MNYPVLAVLALVSLASTSCVVFPQTKPGYGVGVVQVIDVPLGMKIKTGLHASYTVAEGDYRDERLHYEGLNAMPEVANYMRDSMSRRSFALDVEESDNPDHMRLVFKRGITTADCVIRRTEYKTLLEIQVSTSLQN